MTKLLLKKSIYVLILIFSFKQITARAQVNDDVGTKLYNQLNGHSGESVSRVFEFDVNAPIDEAFYLFTPVGEAEWETGFEPLFFKGDGAPRTGLSFWTHNNMSDGEVSEHGEENEITFWLMTSYDVENHKVSYARIKPLSDMSLINVELEKNGDGNSIAKVRYDITGISKAGNDYVKTMDEEYFITWIKGWQSAINGFLETK